MDNTNDGGSVNRPPILDGINYDYWNVKMVSFVKYMENKTWKAMVKGWKHTMIISQDKTFITESPSYFIHS